MKIRPFFFAVWLATLGALAAQPARPGEPTSEASLYGASPASPPQIFQKPPAPQLPQAGTNGTGNATTNPNAPLNNLSGPEPIQTNLTSPPASTISTTPNTNGAVNPNSPMVNATDPDLTNFPMPATPAGIDKDHLIEVGDQIALQITEDREPPHLLLVTEDGTIPVPWTNERLKVTGKDLFATAQRIQTYLSNPELNFYKEGHPTVLARYYHSDLSRGRVYINGAVAKSGFVPIPLKSILTLQEVIQAAGGFRNDADLTHIQIIHSTGPVPPSPTTTPTTTPATPAPTAPTPGPAQPNATADEASLNNVIVLNMDDMLKNHQVPDMPMKPGDFVSVPSKTDVSGYVTVSGKGVNRPGTIALSPTCHTVSQALFLAGYDKFSDLESVELHREEIDPKTGKLAPKIYKLNMYNYIFKADSTADRELQRGDIILVPEKSFITPWS